MRGDGCFIIGRPANIKSDFYYSGDKENPEPRYVPAPEKCPVCDHPKAYFQLQADNF